MVDSPGARALFGAGLAGIARPLMQLLSISVDEGVSNLRVHTICNKALWGRAR